MVRCKFECIEKKEFKGWDKDHPILYGYVFQPVTGGSEENKQFFAATPSGRFEVGTVLVDAFEVGKEYYLDIISTE